jgi:hypothetical protein
MLGAGGFDLTDVQMEVILSSNACRQHLTHLGIGGCAKLTQHTLESLGRHCSGTLTSLNGHNLKGISEDAVRALQEQCGGRLCSIDLQGVQDAAKQPIEGSFVDFPYISDDVPPCHSLR